jgi:hypothetical protein
LDNNSPVLQAAQHWIQLGLSGQDSQEAGMTFSKMGYFSSWLKPNHVCSTPTFLSSWIYKFPFRSSDHNPSLIVSQKQFENEGENIMATLIWSWGTAFNHSIKEDVSFKTNIFPYRWIKSPKALQEAV